MPTENIIVLASYTLIWRLNLISLAGFNTIFCSIGSGLLFWATLYSRIRRRLFVRENPPNSILIFEYI